MKKLRQLLAIMFLLIGNAASYAQIRIEIAKMPALLAPEQGLYFASNINSWDPGDPDYKFQKTADGKYFIELPDSLNSFQYKITQGTWAAVEGDEDGKSRPNRTFSVENDPKHLAIEIARWEQGIAYKFQITEIPANTPHDATLYITGSFNNWNPRDERYKLTRLKDGTYRVKVQTELSKIEYKFTRGTWSSVEGRDNGKGLSNRVISKDKAGAEAIQVNVKTWEDLPRSANSLSFYEVLLLCSSIIGVLAVLIIRNIDNYDKEANRWLITLILMTSGFTAARVLTANKDFVEIFPKMLLAPDFILFTYAPVFLFYVQKLLFNAVTPPANWRWHFVLFVLQTIAYVPLFLMDNTELILGLINQTIPVRTLFAVIGGLAVLVNIAYWLNIRGVINQYKKQSHSSYSYDENLNYLNTVITIKAACLILGLATSIIFIYGWMNGVDVYSAAERCINWIWFLFSSTSYVLGYFAIYKSKIIKLSTSPLSANHSQSGDSPVHSSDKRNDDAMDEVVMQQFKEKLESYMERSKPYTNPQLSINDLAGKLKIQPHVLSRVINECYEKNFFYFINEYRIDEFKRKLEDPEYKKYKLLSIAYEVGFNSKSAFNRSFKKLTNYSPSEYFASRKMDHCELSQETTP